jgi:hypothetical protein
MDMNHMICSMHKFNIAVVETYNRVIQNIMIPRLSLTLPGFYFGGRQIEN